MKVLLACEESQAVCVVLRELGHEAFSCDIQECSGGHPEWHIVGDVLPLLDGDCTFETSTHDTYTIQGQWDMIIAFPPCTHLCSSGQHWFSRGLKDPALREEGAEFFMRFVNAKCDKIAIENPVGIMSTRYRKPDQIINPFQFGHPERKATCLWLKNLPPLRETDNVYEYMMTLPVKERQRVWYLGGGKGKQRSKTYPGIARAMAYQWCGDARETQSIDDFLASFHIIHPEEANA